jgi:HK97 family phage major capsid protein
MRTHSHHVAFTARLALIAAAVASVGIRADVEDPIVTGYRTRQEDLIQRSNALLAQADTAGRELTNEERTSIRDNTAEVERLEGEIELRTRVAAQDLRMREPQARLTPPNGSEPLGDDAAAAARTQARAPGAEPHVQTTQISTAATRAAARGNGGFNTLGHFAQAVRAGIQQPGNMDGRLRAALSTYGNESTGADGGFAVPPDFKTEIMRLVTAEEGLFNRCDTMPTSSNKVEVVTDETSAYSTSGVRVYTRAEAAVMTQSKPSLKEVDCKLHETYAFVPMTDALLEDAPMMSSYLTTKAGEAFQFKLNDYIVNGTGVGQMLGIKNSGALVTVSAEGSQTADTLHGDNVIKMWARMPGAVRGRSVWLINQDLEPQLMKLGVVVGTAAGTATGGMPVYMPPGGLSASPFGTLLGRPVILTEACAGIGDLGDIFLAYMGGYFAPFKSGGVKSDVSMHLYFDQGVTAFRWTLRVGGQPWLSAPIARKNGSNTLSHFVTLAAR